MAKDIKPKHKTYNDKKWESLKKRGLTPPKDSIENAKRAREAHGY